MFLLSSSSSSVSLFAVLWVVSGPHKREWRSVCARPVSVKDILGSQHVSGLLLLLFLFPLWQFLSGDWGALLAIFCLVSGPHKGGVMNAFWPVSVKDILGAMGGTATLFLLLL
jgi:hypothetical protein